MTQNDQKDKVKEPLAVEDQGPFVHVLRLHLTNGETFNLQEVTNTRDVPKNVVAFINAWREMKDVWHSPNGSPNFGVRVRDVVLYEYGVARPQKAEEQTEEKVAEKPADKE